MIAFGRLRTTCPCSGQTQARPVLQYAEPGSFPSPPDRQPLTTWRSGGQPTRHPRACFTTMVRCVGFGPLYPVGDESDNVSVQRAGGSVATSVTCPVR
jgi:hypothetical protein